MKYSEIVEKDLKIDELKQENRKLIEKCNKLAGCTELNNPGKEKIKKLKRGQVNLGSSIPEENNKKSAVIKIIVVE